MRKQYSKRNCILIDGIPKSQNENTDNVVIQTITEHFDVNITEDEPITPIGKTINQSKQIQTYHCEDS